jgi:hypothetical protein
MKFSFRPKALIKLALAAGFAVVAAAIVLAQGPATYVPPDYNNMKVSKERDDVWFETNVGSFKILPRGDVLPSGDLVMSFTGSVLISDLKGAVTPEGNVRREYNNKEKGREVWFGTGKLTIKGSFRGVQWFGRNLKARFTGNGYMRLYGEFDKKLETGYYWFNPKEKKFWGNYGTSFGVPEVMFGPKPDGVKTRDEFLKGKKDGGKG